MFQRYPEAWSPPEDYYTKLQFPQQEANCINALSSNNPTIQLEPQEVAELRKLSIVGSQTTEQIHRLLTTLPPLVKLELLSFSAPLAPGLTKSDPVWWENLKPSSDLGRVALAALLLDRERFPSLQWVLAGDAAWKIEGKLFVHPYIPHEPGIDFL